MNHDQRGWWDPLSSAKGDVFSLVQHLDSSLNFGQVRQLLRLFVGVTPIFPRTKPGATDQTDRPAPATWWTNRRPLKPGSPSWRYLNTERGLPASILIHAASVDAVREGFRGSVWFGHRQNEVVSHVEVRGPIFKGSLRGGTKALFRLAAAGGGMGAGTVAAIQDILEGMSTRGSGELASATDADPTENAYAERHAELARGTGITFLRLRPTSGTDWNDVLKE